MYNFLVLTPKKINSKTFEDYFWVQSWSLHQEPSLGKSDNAFREAIKMWKRENLGTFPKGGGGSAPKSKKSELQIQNIVDQGGGPKFSKKSEFHK